MSDQAVVANVHRPVRSDDRPHDGGVITNMDRSTGPKIKERAVVDPRLTPNPHTLWQVASVVEKRIAAVKPGAAAQQHIVWQVGGEPVVCQSCHASALPLGDTDQSCWVSHDPASSWHISGHHRTGLNHRAITDVHTLEDQCSDANTDIITDQNRAGEEVRPLPSVSTRAAGNRILDAFLRVNRVKISIGNGDVIGDHNSLANPDVLGAHENRTHQHAIIADLQKARGLNVEGCPCECFHSIADQEAGIQVTAKTSEA